MCSLVFPLLSFLAPTLPSPPPQLMKRYTFPNLSEVAQVLSAGFFQLISSIAETFTFIYMGTEIALGEHQRWGHISFIFFSIVSPWHGMCLACVWHVSGMCWHVLACAGMFWDGVWHGFWHGWHG
ncbi:unnamed protein product, partial [Closterium sp. NIES-54]